MGMWWIEVAKARWAWMSERYEQWLSSLTDAMDTNEGQYMTRKIIDHTLQLQETVSLQPGSHLQHQTPPHYLSLDMLGCYQAIKTSRSSTTATDKERTIDGSLENLSSKIGTNI